LAPSRRCCAVRPSRPYRRRGSPAAVGLHPPSSAAVAAGLSCFLCRRRGGSGRPPFAIRSRRRGFPASSAVPSRFPLPLPRRRGFPSVSRAADLSSCVVRTSSAVRLLPAAPHCALPQPPSTCCCLLRRTAPCLSRRPPIAYLPAAPHYLNRLLASAPCRTSAVVVCCTPQGLQNRICAVDFCRTSAVVYLLHAARAAEPDLHHRFLCRPSPPQIWICVVPASAPVAAIEGRVIRTAAAVQLGFCAQDLRQLVLGLLLVAAPLVWGTDIPWVH
jgi:hypothetical protein